MAVSSGSSHADNTYAPATGFAGALPASTFRRAPGKPPSAGPPRPPGTFGFPGGWAPAGASHPDPAASPPASTTHAAISLTQDVVITTPRVRVPTAAGTTAAGSARPAARPASAGGGPAPAAVTAVANTTAGASPRASSRPNRSRRARVSRPVRVPTFHPSRAAAAFAPSPSRQQ